MSEPGVTGIPERLASLDAVRAGALLLGVVLHAMMAYLPDAQVRWGLAAGVAQPSMAIGVYIIHSFRMTLFFFLAGLLAQASIERRGRRSWLVERGRRLLIPLLVAWPLTMLAFWALQSVMAPSPPSTPMPATVPWAHLWFVYLLLVLCALRALLPWTQPAAGAPDVPVTPQLRWWRRFEPWAPGFLALPVIIALALHSGWMAWWGIPTPDQGWWPNLPAFIGYAVAFAAGGVVHRRLGMLEAIVWRRWWFLGWGVLALVLGATLTQSWPDDRVVMGWEAWGWAGVHGCAAWGLTLGLVGLACHHVHTLPRPLTLLAQSAFTVYLVHLPVVVGMQWLASHVGWPAWLELLLVVAGSLVVSLAVWMAGRALRRVTGGRERVQVRPPQG